MEFPCIYTIWVNRNNANHLIGCELSREAAIIHGNRVVSAKDYVIKKFGEISESPEEIKQAEAPQINPNPINEIRFAPKEEPPTTVDLFKDSDYS